VRLQKLLQIFLFLLSVSLHILHYCIVDYCQRTTKNAGLNQKALGRVFCEIEPPPKSATTHSGILLAGLRCSNRNFVVVDGNCYLALL